jgi:hypothetical protein
MRGEFMSRATALACVSVGLAAGLLLAPTGALSAAPSLVGISDNGTRVAAVTRAHQLLAAESDPADAVVISAGSDQDCTAVYTVPPGKALVLKNATYNLEFRDQATGTAELVSGPTCFGAIWSDEWAIGANTVQTVEDDLGSEAVLPSGTELDFAAGGGFLYSHVTARGYLIPASAAPKGATVVSDGASRISAMPRQ